MGLLRTADPTDEPLSAVQAKAHLRIDTADDDTYIDDCISDATQDLEEFTERQLITATWTWKLDAFPLGSEVFTVPRPPLASVTSINYVDEDGDTQTFAAAKYDVDTYSQPGRIALAFDQTWPNVRTGVVDVVTIVFVAGYGADETAMPGNVLRAMRLLVADYYENREPSFNGAMVRSPALERLMWGLRNEIEVA